MPAFDGSEEHRLITKTDANILQVLDPDTLEPLEIFDYTKFNKALDGQISAAHACYFDGAMYNYCLKMGRTSRYTVFEIRSTGARVLATITDAPPAYIHSVACTERYVGKSNSLK